MIVTMKTSVAIECGEGEQYFVLRMECCWILYLSCHSQPSSLEMNQTFSHVFCPAPNKCRRGLQRGICAESFLRRVFFPPIPWKRSTRNRHRQLKGSCTTVTLQKDSRDKPTRCNQLIGGWLNLACFVSIDILVTCQLPNLSAKRGSHGQVGMDILDIFNAFMLLPCSNLEGRYSFVHPAHDWGECVKWGNLSHSDCLKRRCWGWGVWTFWMVTGTALLKVKMRKGTQYCSITSNTEKKLNFGWSSHLS